MYFGYIGVGGCLGGVGAGEDSLEIIISRLGTWRLVAWESQRLVNSLPCEIMEYSIRVSRSSVSAIVAGHLTTRTTGDILKTGVVSE